MLHNCATLLYKHDYDDIAGEYWYEAYQRDPSRPNVQRVYADYLLRERRPDLSALVIEGQPLPEKVVRPQEKILPDQLTADPAARWWQEIDNEL